MAGLVPYWVHTPVGLLRMLLIQASAVPLEYRWSTPSSTASAVPPEYPWSSMEYDAAAPFGPVSALAIENAYPYRENTYRSPRKCVPLSREYVSLPTNPHALTGAGAVGAGAALRPPLAVAAAARGSSREGVERYARVRVEYPVSTRGVPLE